MSLANIMSLFSGSSTPPAQNPAPVGPTGVANPGVALPGTQQTPATGANGVVPTQPQQLETPFDNFKDIWQTPKNAQPDNSGPMFANVDPKKLLESARNVDFSKTITPASLQAIAAGGEGAMKAFTESMNQVAQQVYAQSAFAATKIVDEAMTRNKASFDAQLPTMIKRHSVNEGLTSTNPLLSNPAIVPLVEALQSQLVLKNPNASSAELQTQVMDYLSALGTAFAPKAPETPQSRAAASAAKSDDWSSFLQ
jgi:hypothetical protein